MQPDSGTDDVLLFAKNLTKPLRFKNFHRSSVPEFISLLDRLDEELNFTSFGTDSMVLDPLTRGMNATPEDGYFVFVCAHQARDNRCGNCGPEIFKELQNLLKLLNFESETVPIQIGKVSHVGGHKYAGNVMIYPPGDHYGYVNQGNVLDIVKTHITERNVTPQNWRGRMGVADADQRATLDNLVQQTPPPLD